MNDILLHDLSRWLAPVDGMRVECDGATRVISALLVREGIDHAIEIGALDVAGVGRIPYHWWIRLGQAAGGDLIDYRARMWLGLDSRVPHGVFSPTDVLARFEVQAMEPAEGASHPIIFWALTGMPIEDYPTFEQHMATAADSARDFLRIGRRW